MGLNDSASKLADTVKGTLDNAKDSISEVTHRSTAEAEKLKRSAAGDQMTTGEKVGSFVNEKKHQTQAEMDAAKRDLRNRM